MLIEEQGLERKVRAGWVEQKWKELKHKYVVT